MTIARQPRAVTFTAVNEGLALPYTMQITGITFRGTGLTAAQRLTVRDGATVASGSILADYAIEAATDNADLWAGRSPQNVTGLSIDNNTIDGTWLLTVFIRD